MDLRPRRPQREKLRSLSQGASLAATPFAATSIAALRSVCRFRTNGLRVRRPTPSRLFSEKGTRLDNVPQLPLVDVMGKAKRGLATRGSKKGKEKKRKKKREEKKNQPESTKPTGACSY
ncbi:hypothetical protein LY76DRAFT_596224, partial [Colletotrichum caudatum]